MTTSVVATPVAAPVVVIAATLPLTGEQALNFVPNTPATRSVKNLVNTIKKLGHVSRTFTILKEFEWHQKDTIDIKEMVINQTSLMHIHEGG